MTLDKQDFDTLLKQRTFATMVTQGPEGLASRTMLIGYDPEHGVFMLTRTATEKITHIEHNAAGLVHVGEITEDLTASYDISMKGQYHNIAAGSPEHSRGSEVLGAKNPMLKDLLASSMADDYTMLLFRITETSGWTYQQAVDGLPKTVLG